MANRRISHPWEAHKKTVSLWEKEVSRDSLPGLVIFIFILIDLKLTEKLFASLSVICKNGGPWLSKLFNVSFLICKRDHNSYLIECWEDYGI